MDELMYNDAEKVRAFLAEATLSLDNLSEIGDLIYLTDSDSPLRLLYESFLIVHAADCEAVCQGELIAGWGDPE